MENTKYNPVLKVNNKIVPRCDSAIHLGHLLHTENTTSELIEQAIIDFNKSFNGFLARLAAAILQLKTISPILLCYVWFTIMGPYKSNY